MKTDKKNFTIGIYSLILKRIYVTNKTDVYYIDDTWSITFLDLKYYGSKNKQGYRYFFRRN